MKILSFDVGTRNLAYCLIEIHQPNTTQSQTQQIKILQWERIDIFKQNGIDIDKASQYPVNQLYKLVHASLMMRLWIWTNREIDIILIEQQRPNTPNIIIESMLTMWFHSYLAKPIVPVSPTLKLKLSWNQQWVMNKKAVKKEECNPKKYTIGVVTKWLLPRFGQRDCTFFHQNKKADDLADSFMQAVAWFLCSSKSKKKRAVT